MARRRDKEYLYHIFMDDDIILKTKTNKYPWRMFDWDFLKEVEPAVPGISGCWQPPMYTMQEKKQGCTLNQTLDYLPAAWFDEAFHYQAVKHILPYLTKHDAISWRYAGLHDVCCSQDRNHICGTICAAYWTNCNQSWTSSLSTDLERSCRLSFA